MSDIELDLLVSCDKCGAELGYDVEWRRPNQSHRSRWESDPVFQVTVHSCGDCVEKAREQGHEAGKQEGHKAGYDEGYASAVEDQNEA